MTYEEWEEAVPEAIKADSLWRMKAYRLALFLADLGILSIIRGGCGRSPDRATASDSPKN
ncbi:MAG: hypothetical protein AUK03_16630 [Anaerolineae bacterium CG2_30_64_16]|nr:MAG: hypothetical protein AUK03_16630 [Anaerolineae bacterium CG2_30_64_16]